MKRCFKKSTICGLFIVLYFSVNLTACSFFKNENVIRIGFMGSFTGGKYSDWGNNTRDGAIFAVDQINKAGGINGKQIELVIKDDRHDPVYAEKLLDEFLEERINIIIGPVLSSVAIAIIPPAQKKGILLISPSVSTDELTGRDDIFLRVASANSYHGIALADFVIKKRGWRSICITIDESNPASSTSWRDGFIKRFTELGGRVIFKTGFKSGSNYRSMSAELIKNKPDGILIVSGAIDAAAISQEIRKLGSTIPIAAAGTAMANELLANGGDAVEGMLLAPSFFDDNSSSFKEFKSMFKKNFGNDPTYSVVLGYDAAHILLSSITAEGTWNDINSIRKSILTTKKFSSPIGNFEIDSSGDTQRAITIVSVKNGKFIKAE